MGAERSVLLAGATGLVGSHCLEKLLALGVHDKVIVIARNPIDFKTPALTEAYNDGRLILQVVDFESLEQQAQLFAVDEVICCLGTTLKQAGSIENFRRVDFDYCYKIASLAKNAGVEHFLIVTAINANEKSFAYYSKIKGQLQNALKKLKFKRLSIFQPSLLLGEREKFRLGESIGSKLSGVMNALLPSSMNAYKAIDGRVVGYAMATLAAYPQALEGESVSYLQYYKMNELLSYSKEL